LSLFYGNTNFTKTTLHANMTLPLLC
jgi:hypothetical protein